MNRRAFLEAAASTALAAGVVSAPIAVPRIFGAADRLHGSERFRGPGWYAFGSTGAAGMVVKFAARDGQGFIALSNGPDDDPDTYLSPRRFDALCWGVCRSASEVEAERSA